MQTKPIDRFFGSRVLARILTDVGPIACLDIGARGGPKEDLEPLAPAVNVYCFEPDAAECDRLNTAFRKSASPFNEVRFFPVALGGNGGRRTLHVTRHPGTSSLLPPLPEAGAKFSRPQYTDVVKTVEVETVPLDMFADQNALPKISFIKIDVEGFELEILKSAEQMLAASVVALRTEVSFFPLREGQPLFCDMADYLKTFDFIPMGFAELHHWRRYSKEKHMRMTDDPIPFSRGQLAHGDMIFFREPDGLPVTSEEDLRTQVKAAFLAMSYGFIDHAAYLLNRREVRDFLKPYGMSVEQELGTVARELAKTWNYTGRGKLFGRKKIL